MPFTGRSTPDSNTHSVRSSKGELKGETQQANEYARWARRLTDGLTVRLLQDTFGTQRTTWSQYLSGQSLMPLHLMEKVVHHRERDERTRQHLLSEGRRLHAEAVRASTGKVVAPRRPPAAGVMGLQQNLNEALQKQLQAQEAAHKAQQSVQTLLVMVGSLQARCTLLESERDHALDQARVIEDATLARSGEQLERAQQELARAREERDRAEAAQQALREEVEQVRLELQQLQGAEDATGSEAPPQREPSEVDYDFWLDGVSRSLDEQAEALSDLERGDGRAHAVTPEQVEEDSGQLPPTPFWFCVSLPLPAYKKPGDRSSFFQLQPGEWYLALEISAAGLALQAPDKRLGYLRDYVQHIYVVPSRDGHVEGPPDREPLKVVHHTVVDNSGQLPEPPFWFAVPQRRPVFKRLGDWAPMYQLEPGLWHLAVGTTSAGLRVQDQKGRRGYLQDLAGIQVGDA